MNANTRLALMLGLLSLGIFIGFMYYVSQRSGVHGS